MTIIAVFMTGPSVAVASAAPAGEDGKTDYVSNGSFDDGLTGWHGNRSTALSVVTTADSGNVARMNNRAQRTASTVINDRLDSVASTKKGHTYVASARVRALQPNQSVAIRLREWAHASPQPTILGQETTHLWVTNTRWNTVQVEYTAHSAGGSLDLNIIAQHLQESNYVEIDNVSLRDLASEEENRARNPGNEWKLVFSDEFSGTEVNSDNWKMKNRSTYGDGNDELACLMDRPQNLSVGSGILTLRAQAERPALRCGSRDARFPLGRSYSSAFLDSGGKASFTYGRFEIRAKTPNTYGSTKGLWPAFWLRPDDGGVGEIDIFEIIGTSPGDPDTSGRTTQSIHFDYVKTHPKQNNAYDLPEGMFADGFHTHALEWGPGYLRWYVDDTLTYERTLETTPWLVEAFSRPFHMRLNLAVGGNWTGSPDTHTKFPADFNIDYVRVYQHR